MLEGMIDIPPPVDSGVVVGSDNLTAQIILELMLNHHYLNFFGRRQDATLTTVTGQIIKLQKNMYSNDGGASRGYQYDSFNKKKTALFRDFCLA